MIHIKLKLDVFNTFGKMYRLFEESVFHIEKYQKYNVLLSKWWYLYIYSIGHKYQNNKIKYQIKYTDNAINTSSDAKAKVKDFLQDSVGNR